MKLNLWRKNILYALLILVIVSLLPVVISQIIRIPTGKFTIGNEESWVSFFGGYVGAITGLVGVYLVAKLQINAQNKEIDIERKFKVRPYIRAVKSSSGDGDNQDVQDINFHFITPSDDYISPEIANHIGTAIFDIENVGLGTAVDIFFSAKDYLRQYEKTDVFLGVGERHSIKLTTFLHNLDTYELILYCSDLLGNTYTQNIIFDVNKRDNDDGYNLTINRTKPPEIRII